MKNRQNQKGQTMLEIVVAIAVVTIGLLGILGLVAANIAGGEVSQNQIVAANLAREGAEVARHLRDSNWLAHNEWDDGLVDDDYYTAIAVFDFAGNHWRLEFNPGEVATQMYLNTQTGVYKQDLVPPDSPFKATAFHRLIVLNEICGNQADNYKTEEAQANGARCVNNAGYPNKIGVKVEVKVSWLERGRHQELAIEDRLYNWK